MSRFTDWMYHSIMPQAVDYELPVKTKPSGFLSQLHRLMVKIADSIFSCFQDYSRERESLKARCLRQIISPSAPLSSPPPSPSSLAGRVTLPPIALATLSDSTKTAEPTPAPITPVHIEILDDPLKVDVGSKTSIPSLHSEPFQAAVASPSKFTQKQAEPQKKTPSKRGALWSTGAKVLKVAFLAGLAIGGVAGLASFFGGSATGSPSLAARTRDDAMHTLRSQIDSLQVPLEDMRWQQQESPEVSSLARHYLTELHTIRGELEESNAAGLEVLAQQVDDLQKTILSIKPPIPHVGTTPVSLLSRSSAPISKLTESHLSAILELPSSEEPSIQLILDYLIKSLDHLGENPQLRQKALDLHSRLSTFREFAAQQFPSLKRTLAQAQLLQKVTEGMEDDETRSAQVRQAWNECVSQTRQFIIERLQQEGGLILPYSGAFVSITPEAPKGTSSLLWTVRIYERQGASESDLQYNPYREKQGITQEQLLTNRFIAAIIGPSLKDDLLSHSELEKK